MEPFWALEPFWAFGFIFSFRFFKLPTQRGTSLTRKRTPLGPYRRPMPRVLGGSQGVVRFLMGEVPL